MSHYRFRRAFLAQGHQLSELKYHALLFPFGPIFAFILCLVVIVGQNIDAFVKLDWSNILITYMSLPIVIILYLYYKLRYGSKLIPLDQVDLSRKTKGEEFTSEDDQ